MVTTATRFTIDDLVQLPSDAPYELWRGELVEVPPAGFESSGFAFRIGVRLFVFVEQHGLGMLTDGTGGYVLFADDASQQSVVAPDVGFIRKSRLPERPWSTAFCPVPPDLAVEVTSLFDEPGNMRRKLALYMDAGVPLVWWVDPKQQLVRVYRPGQPEQVLGIGDTLDGGNVLPGFELNVADIFAR